MRRLRPSLLIGLLFYLLSFSLHGQSTALLIDTNIVNTSESPNPERIINITKNSDLNRLMITSTESIDGHVELTISDPNGLFNLSTCIETYNTKLVTYPSAMLDSSVYKVSCTIKDEVWVQMVYVAKK